MDMKAIDELIDVLKRHKFKSFINHNSELIVIPKYNIYLNLSAVDSPTMMRRKVLSWLSRPCVKGISTYSQQKLRRALNDYLGKQFTYADFEAIYATLGNDINPKKMDEFIASGMDLHALITPSS